MAQLFPSYANVLARLSILGVVVLVTVIAVVATLLYWSPVVTQVEVAKEQIIPFSHQRHVQGNGIDCRYCHTSVEDSSFAGIPPTETCMTCHSQVLADAPMLEPVRDSWKTGDPLQWVRVSDLPDFVYFNHSIHVNKGIGCSTCHGRVDEMPLTWKVESFRMSWCLSCHENPGKHLRPLDEVFNMEWKPPSNQGQIGPRLVTERDIRVEQLTDCSICHR